MPKQANRELLNAIRPRYLKANKIEKSQILNEFVVSTRYYRKYAIHLFRNGTPRSSRNKKRGRRLIYGPDVLAALARIWEARGHLCAKRLHPFLPQMVEALERHNEIHMAPETKEKLLQMSISTIGRRLKRTRGQLARHATKPGTLLKNALPIRTFADWDEQLPGFVEKDLMAHCGDSAVGEVPAYAQRRGYRHPLDRPCRLAQLGPESHFWRHYDHSPEDTFSFAPHQQ